MKLSRKLTFLILVLVIISAGGYFYFYKYLPAKAAPTPVLQTAKVRTGDILVTTSGIGNLFPAKEVDLSFRSGGVIAELNVALGEQVKAGDLLASLDDTSAQQQLATANATLQGLLSPGAILQSELDVYNAQKGLDEANERLELLVSLTELAAQGEDVDAAAAPSENEIGLARLSVNIAEEKLLEAQVYSAILKAESVEEEQRSRARGANLSRLEAAQQAVENAQLNLENNYLVAPITGTVIKLNAVLGGVAGSSPLITLAIVDQPMVRFYVEETELSMVTVGARVLVTLDAYPDHTLEGKVVSIEPSLAMVDGSPALGAWASIETDPELALLPGLTADVEVIAGEVYGVLQVPIAALRELSPGTYAVFVVQADGQLKATPVQVGLKDFTNAEILSGLNPGDIVSTGNVETR